MLELLRRLLTLGCLLAAVWAFVTPAPQIYQLHPLQSAEEISEARSPRNAERIQPVSGPAWTQFFTEAVATARSQPPNADWRQRYGTGGLPDYLYVRAEEAPLADIRAELSNHGRISYLALGQGTQTRYLTVDRLRVADALTAAPAWLTHPYREWTIVLLALAFLIYLALPWPKRNQFSYIRANSVYAPDWLGFGLAAFCFALVLLVISRDGSFADTMETQRWGAITAWALLGIIPGVAVTAVGLWYSTLAITLTATTLRVRQLFATREMALADIVEVRPCTAQSPRWLIVTVTLLTLCTLGAQAYLLILVRQQHPGIEIVDRQGRVIRILLTYLPDAQVLLRALAAAGATLTGGLGDNLDETPATPTPARRPALAGAVLLGLFLLGGLAAFWIGTSHYSPAYPQPAIPTQPLTAQDIEAQQQHVAAMEAALAAAETARQRYESAPAAQRDAAYQAYMDAMTTCEKLLNTTEASTGQ